MDEYLEEIANDPIKLLTEFHKNDPVQLAKHIVWLSRKMNKKVFELETKLKTLSTCASITFVTGCDFTEEQGKEAKKIRDEYKKGH